MIWYREEKEKKKRRNGERREGRGEIKKYQNTILIIMYGPLQFHIFYWMGLGLAIALPSPITAIIYQVYYAL